VQKRLNRAERAENLKGKIYLYGRSPKIVVIIDDVTTTGSTMEICSSVLKEHGAEIVYGICLFYD
jgi:predicted amidophosphoribosyltransferase